MDVLEEARRLVAEDDRKDFEFAERGFIATRKDPQDHAFRRAAWPSICRLLRLS